MQNAIFSGLILLCVSLTAAGATYTLSNNKGPINTNSIVDNAGSVIIDDATAYVGFFADDADIFAASTTADLVSSFTIFTSGGDGSDLVTETSGIQGVFTAEGSGVDLSVANAFSGENVYLLVTHNSVEEALVFKFSTTFANSEPTTVGLTLEGPTTAGADLPTGGTLLLGGYDNFDVDPAPSIGPTTGNAAFNLDLIPEPSSTAMLGLGGMMLLLRRRK